MNACHLCEYPKGIVFVKSTGLWFCRNRVACNYRARLRLGIPKWQANRLRADERSVA